MTEQHPPIEAQPQAFTVANWYNARYLSGQEQSFGRPFEESILRLRKLGNGSNLHVLDVGCGQGYFLKAGHDAGHRMTGIDIALEAIKVARRICPEAQTCVGTGGNLPFPSHSFDVLTCWGALEHHPDMQQALAEFVRVAKDLLIIRVPNRHFWGYTARYLVLGKRAGTEQADMIEHLLSLREWITLFRHADLEVISVEPDNWFLHQKFGAVRGVKVKMKLAQRKFSLVVAPLPLTYCFDFVLAPTQSKLFAEARADE